MTEFWSQWIVIITVISLFIGYSLVWMDAKEKSGGNEHDKDDAFEQFPEVKVYHHPVPSAWLYFFYASLLIVIGYFTLYPGLGKFPGTLNWTAQHQFAIDHSLYRTKYSQKLEKYLINPIPEIAKDPVAREIGKQLYLTYCTNCHSPDPKRAVPHYPDLTDADWLWGGEPEQIKESIIKGRVGIMPDWGKVLGEQEVGEITNYVMTLEGRWPINEYSVNAGKKSYVVYCQFCHGSHGEGDVLLGAPNLVDSIWLHIDAKDAETDTGLAAGIQQAIEQGFNSAMPPHWKTLDQARIHLITGYIYSLSQ